MKTAGLCTNCGSRPAGISHQTCDQCYQKASDCRKIWRQSKRTKGICYDCNNPSLPNRTYCEKHQELAMQYQVRLFEQGYYAKRNWNLFKKVLKIYGEECACCQENNPAFLTVDHINNDGHKERRSPTGGRGNNYSRLLSEFRSDIQILCWNCNCGKQRLGICPHKVAS